MFIGQNVNAFFDIVLLITRSPDIRVHRAGSQLKIGFMISTLPENLLRQLYPITDPVTVSELLRGPALPGLTVAVL